MHAHFKNTSIRYVFFVDVYTRSKTAKASIGGKLMKCRNMKEEGRDEGSTLATSVTFHFCGWGKGERHLKSILLSVKI